MSDRELLELAAKAAGIEVTPHRNNKLFKDLVFVANGRNWNPLTDDGDALRLAVELFDGDDMEVIWYRAKLLLAEYPQLGRVAATRRAIVRAAAEIGRNMP